MRLLWFAVILLAAGCSDSPQEKPRVQRKVDAQALADQPPKRKTYQFEEGQLVVLDIATVGPRGVADSQKCFLWRDAEFRTASLQCPNDSPGEDPVDTAHDRQHP